MQPATANYTCQACGHSFAASPDIIAKQPTCPRCRTFGKLSGPGVGARKQVVKVSPGAARGGPVGPAPDDEPVTVAADVAYGRRSNPKAIINGVILVALGIGMVVTMYFIVTAFKGDRAAELKKEKEEVLDKADFEKAVDEAVKKARAGLTRVEGAEVRETTNFDEPIVAIAQAGADVPQWKQGIQPGTPFRAVGFTIKAKDKRTGVMVHGFVMLLYYLKADEVAAAFSKVQGDLTGLNRFSVKENRAVWYVAYGGASYGGEVYDAIMNAMNLGTPVPEQFKRRTGSAEYKG